MRIRKRIRKQAALLAALLLPAILLSGCREEKVPEAKASFFAMDTYITLKIIGTRAEDAAAACREEIERIEHLLSVTVPESDIAQINASDGKETEVSPETIRLLYAANAVSERTDGLFDCTVYPLVAAWGFFGNEETEGRVPSEIELLRAYPPVGYEKMKISDGTTFSSCRT